MKQIDTTSQAEIAPPPALCGASSKPWHRPHNVTDSEAIRRAELAALHPPAPEIARPAGRDNIARFTRPDPRQTRPQEDQTDFAALMPDVAERLLESPNRALSSSKELRYGSRGSLAVDVEKGVFHDHEAGTGGGVLDLIARENGGDHAAAVDWLRAEGLLDGDRPKTSAPARKPQPVAAYDYVDEHGELLFQVVRFDPKTFRQRAANGDWCIKGIRQVPYNLPELIARPDGAPVFIVEGEKDADRLAALGLTATCNAGGAGRWPAELTGHFVGADVVVLPDNDDPGRAHGEKVEAALAGTAARVRVVELPGLPVKGDVSDWLDAGGTVAELVALAEGAPDGGPFAPEALDVFLAGDITPRQWVYGKDLCKQYVTVLAAAGGSGKTALATMWALSMATGRNLIGQHVHKRCRVLMLTFEDGREEYRRRFKAACVHHRIDPADVGDRIMIQSLNGLGVTLAKPQRDGTMEATAAPRQIAGLIDRLEIDAVILDPWVKVSGAPENDNGAVDAVTRILSGVAEKQNVAVLVAHHFRKAVGAPGDVASARGASALIDAARAALTLTPMSPDESKHYGIPEDERRRLVRLDDGKANLAPLSGTRWYRMASVNLQNGTPDYPNGDNLQVVEQWTPPDTWAGLSCALLNKILDDLDAGLDDGERYSGASSAKPPRAAWAVVEAYAPEKSEGQCREIIKAWIRSGLLQVVKYQSAKRRTEREGLAVDPSKRPRMEFA